jgi:hypothetical protein
MERARQAWVSGDYRRSLALIDESLATENRLGRLPGHMPLDLIAVGFRGAIASSEGALAEAAAGYLDAAERAGAAGMPGLEAIHLAASASALAWEEPGVAVERATRALALARRSGTAIAITNSLSALSQALAPNDADRASSLLRQAIDTPYDNGRVLGTSVFAAARLADWPTCLSISGRLLRLDRRSGTIPLDWLSGVFNLVARGVVEAQPEPAAVLQGAARALLPEQAPSPGAAGGSADGRGLGGLIELIVSVRRDTTQWVVGALGEPRMRELRAQGEAMDRDQAGAYAIGHIEDALVRVARTHPEAEGALP